jgi:hypothetical protein
MNRKFSVLTAILLFACSTIINAVEEGDINSTVPKEFPRIPIATVQRYQASVIDVTLEQTSVQRLRLSGPQTLILDPLPGYQSVATEGQCSTRFELQHAPTFRVEFFAFPARNFGFPLNDESLNLYAQGLSLNFQAEQEFKIIELAAFNGVGPAKFRIFGKRARTLRYSYRNEDTDLVVGENWIENDGTLYMVRVQAPRRSFAREYKEVKASFNSISVQE